MTATRLCAVCALLKSLRCGAGCNERRLMSDEKNVELGVFEALNALAEEKNASAETRETLRKNVRESSDAQQGTERRSSTCPRGRDR